MIGIFDSGVGGLTVLKALRERLPQESFLYLGDTARLPYGTKSPATIRKYLEQNIAFLLNQNVKAIVVACNSASSVLKENESFPVPVYNVIKPGAAQAARVTQTGKVGVLGTRATVAGGAYVSALKKASSQVKVFQQACPLLVPMVEEGMIEDILTVDVLTRYLTELFNQEEEIDTIILGCTHYPALKELIQNLVAPGTALIDSAVTLSTRLKQDIDSGRLPPQSSGPALTRVMVTDFSPTFERISELLMAPHRITDVTPVSL